MLSAQDKIQRATFRIQNKLHDLTIKVLGTGATSSFLLTIEEDKFHNNATVITSYKNIYCKIIFPGDEIPVRPSSIATNRSNNVLALYDILPIEARFLISDNVRIGDVVLYKIKLNDGSYQVLPLQVVDNIVKGNMANIVLQRYIVAPITDYVFLQNASYLSIVSTFTSTDNW